MKDKHRIVKLEVKDDDLYITYKVEAATHNEEIDYLNRLTTCFNALRGIPSTAIDRGIVREMVGLLKRLRGQGYYDFDTKSNHDELDDILARLEGNDEEGR